MICFLVSIMIKVFFSLNNIQNRINLSRLSPGHLQIILQKSSKKQIILQFHHKQKFSQSTYYSQPRNSKLTWPHYQSFLWLFDSSRWESELVRSLNSLNPSRRLRWGGWPSFWAGQGSFRVRGCYAGSLLSWCGRRRALLFLIVTLIALSIFSIMLYIS